MNDTDAIAAFTILNFSGMSSKDVIEEGKPIFKECVKLLSEEWSQIQNLKKAQLFEDYNIQKLQMQIEAQYPLFVETIKTIMKRDLALKIMSTTLNNAECEYIEKLQKMTEKICEYNNIVEQKHVITIPEELTMDEIIENNPFYEEDQNGNDNNEQTLTINNGQKQRKRRRKMTEASFENTTDDYTDIELRIWKS